MSSVKKKSLIWKYFDINSKNPKFADCLLCCIRISRGGEGKKAGTSAMSNHLKSKHPEQFQLLNKNKAKVIPTLHVELAIPGTSLSSTLTENISTLSESFEKEPDINVAQENKIHYLIAEMIALDNEPLCVIERVGFTRLLEQALPHYKLPSRNYISQKVIPDIYGRIFEKIKASISSVTAISITSDIWTCLHNNSSFLSFTSHWLSPKFQLQHGVLAINPFSGSHTEENIANEMNCIAAHWDINQSKIHILIHNSNANMVEDVRGAEYDSTRCFIHSLQRVVNESLKVQPEVTDMIATVRRLVTHFSHSGFAQENLLIIQKKLSLPQHQLVQDTSSRWNSTYYMVERLLEQRRTISLYVAEYETLNNNLTSQQWCLMEQYVMLLKPFEEITKIMSSGLSCISEVIPYIAALKKYLDKDETTQRTSDLLLIRASLKAELESLFKSIEKNTNYLIATFLDPRFKTNYLGTIESERARQKIMLEYIKMTCDESSCSGSFTSSAKKYRGNETNSNFTHDSRDTFWNCFNEVADDNINQCRDQEKNQIASEMDYYLKTIRIDRNRNPYNWWSVNSKQYPHLSKFARVYLSAPCSSVYNERLFSEAGLVYENKRNRLLSANTENLAFIHHNLPLINFEY